MLLSRYLAKRLAIGVSDTITIYLVKGREDIRPRKFAVKGLYETGLEKIDHQARLHRHRRHAAVRSMGLKAEILGGRRPLTERFRGGSPSVRGRPGLRL
ncbi:MAG: hypothetical protein IPN85_18275 [Flavobacteriales bacterium]|nr:hypothetical protein [Flavobacteriales bacterium]